VPSTAGLKAAQALLARNSREAYALAAKKGTAETAVLMERAHADLTRRLGALRPEMAESFTAAQMRAALMQVELVQRQLNRQLGGLVVAQAADVADAAVGNVVDYMQRVEREYSGVGRQPLALKEVQMLDRATQGVQSTVLRRLGSGVGIDQTGFGAQPGILARYGMEVIGNFETAMQIGMIAKKPWEAVKSDLIAQSPFLQGAPKYWAERIVRTETMGAYNRASWEGMRSAEQQLGDMVKILAATFDNRTGADSYAVHGQIRRMEQAFEWWDGMYQHPPNRPNDREVVVPHRMSWAIPEYLRWRSDGEVAARWQQEGRKGSPPPRPEMTTVPLAQFGND